MCLLIPLIVTVKADKYCSENGCAVPDNADCDFYAEVISSTIASGGEYENGPILVKKFRASNCERYNDTITVEQTYSISVEKAVSLEVTAGTSVGSSVKLAASAGPLASAEATASINTSISGTESDTESVRTTDSVKWTVDVDACEKKGANVLATWTECTWTKEAWIDAYYYLENSNGPIYHTKCAEVVSEATGQHKYDGHEVSAVADEQCDPCP